MARQTINPYAQLIAMMREQGAAMNPPTLLLGEVVSAAPLSVSAAGLQLDEGDLLVPDWLTAGYSRMVQIDGAAKPMTFMTNGIEAGSILLLLPTADGQKFAVLGRVM